MKMSEWLKSETDPLRRTTAGLRSELQLWQCNKLHTTSSSAGFDSDWQFYESAVTCIWPLESGSAMDNGSFMFYIFCCEEVNRRRRGPRLSSVRKHGSARTPHGRTFPCVWCDLSRYSCAWGSACTVDIKRSHALIEIAGFGEVVWRQKLR